MIRNRKALAKQAAAGTTTDRFDGPMPRALSGDELLVWTARHHRGDAAERKRLTEKLDRLGAGRVAEIAESLRRKGHA